MILNDEKWLSKPIEIRFIWFKHEKLKKKNQINVNQIV